MALPWVRLHGIKDYLDMVNILEGFPEIHQTFNLVPCLLEQIEDYASGVSDEFQRISYKRAEDLSEQEKGFILNNFFKANPENLIAAFPRYYELWFKKKNKKHFSTQDFLDLQVLFNLAWFDPSFRKRIPELKCLPGKGRFFSEEEKVALLDKQIDIIKDIIPTYRRFQDSGQIEITTNPYYHPILPLLFDSKIALRPAPKSALPNYHFSYPQDAKLHLEKAVELYKKNFGCLPRGIWPSEEAVSEEILQSISEHGIKWMLSDEALLFKSIRKRRAGRFLYRPFSLRRRKFDLNIIFRDAPLSNLLGFVYHKWPEKKAVEDFIVHLRNINKHFKNRDILVAIAMDGENAWEYYKNDGIDFLKLLYGQISQEKNVKTVTVSEYLNQFPPKANIRKLSAGSWINADFSKWIGSKHKNIAWEWLVEARRKFDDVKSGLDEEKHELAIKQMLILEGSDWFWWYDDNPGEFDDVFRMHLSNFYKIVDVDPPSYLKEPLEVPENT